MSRPLNGEPSSTPTVVHSHHPNNGLLTPAFSKSSPKRFSEFSRNPGSHCGPLTPEMVEGRISWGGEPSEPDSMPYRSSYNERNDYGITAKAKCSCDHGGCDDVRCHIGNAHGRQGQCSRFGYGLPICKLRRRRTRGRFQQKCRQKRPANGGRQAVRRNLRCTGRMFGEAASMQRHGQGEGRQLWAVLGRLCVSRHLYLHLLVQPESLITT